MSLRLNCCIPGCRHTRGQRKGEPPIREDEEWVCGVHWKSVPAFLRRRRAKLARRYRHTFGDASYWHYPAGTAQRIEAVRLDRMLRRVWSICKRGAIERGVGIR